MMRTRLVLVAIACLVALVGCDDDGHPVDEITDTTPPADADTAIAPDTVDTTGHDATDLDDSTATDADVDVMDTDLTDVDPGPAPSVVSTVPADGAVDVARAAPVRVTFDRALDPASIDATTFALAPTITGQYDFDPVGLTATFQPNRLMDADTVYTVTVDGVRAVDGAAMTAPVSFSFTTGQAVDPPVGDTVYVSGSDRAEVSVDDRDSDARTYTLTTTAELRDDDPASKQVTFAEQPGQVRLRSGNLMFDALFAMAIEEARQNSVSQISDWAFNNGAGVACDCFETGAKWNYVWTRDTAYAVDLGLALIDAPRARNSLDFKLSDRKATGADPEIVQDTGSGGSWPVSSDRVVWSLGARATLASLSGAERDAFAARAYEAMANTIERDREIVFDAADGLYRGEQSFLDWREQSYPSWTADDTVHIAMGKSLSTNVGHLVNLRTASELADAAGDTTARDRYAGWAEALRTAIDARFWLEDVGLYSALIGPDLDPAVLHKFDLLGLSLAVLHDVADPGVATELVARYPHGPLGPPVLWPQQPLVPIYHNRGQWPFVTAYALLAARHVGNDAVFDHTLESLVRGAALNLSNMENFEFLTQRAWLDDGAYSGPVVNSRRQLWSVAGYFGAVTKGIFGVETRLDGRLRVRPFVTRSLRARWFGSTDLVELRDLDWQGRKVTIRLHLPATLDSTGPLTVDAVEVDGTALPQPDAWLDAEALGTNPVIDVTLVDGGQQAATMTIVEDTGDFRRFWAPKEPTITALTDEDGQLRVDFDVSGEQGVEVYVFRDGVEVAGPLSGVSSWVDPNTPDLSTRAPCYAIESVFPSSGNRSHHSRPSCWWGGADNPRIQALSAYHFEDIYLDWSTLYGRPHYGPWGAPTDTLRIATVVAHHDGAHLLQLGYGNGAASIDTGITASLKRVRVTDVASGAVVTDGHVVMPQLGDWARWGDSSLLRVDGLQAGRTYAVDISDAENMSYFEHFTPYTAAPGGGPDPYNDVNISTVRLLALDGARGAGTPSLALDGVDDLGKLPAGNVVVPGAQLEPWSRFGLEWDDEFIYLAVTSAAFESDYKPAVVYLEAVDGALPTATPSTGFEYSGIVPQLPFSPTHALTLRAVSGTGTGDGPWNGLWTPQAGGTWRQVRRFEPEVDWFLAGDRHTVSLRIRRAELGDPSRVRLVAHVVNALIANEWKELAPVGHTPWLPGGGDHFEIDLSQPSAATNWTTP